MMSGIFASGALLLAARCAPFASDSGAPDSGASDSGALDSGASDGGALDSGAEGSVDGSDAGGAVYVQERTNTASNTTTLTVTLRSPPANGHALVLVVGADTAFPSSVAGGGVTTWNKRVQAGAHVATSIWIGLGVSSATPDVTVTWSGQQSAAVALLTEWAGISAFDSPGATSSDRSTTPTVMPFAAQPGQLLFAAAGTQSTASPPMNTGFSAIDGAASSGSVHVVGAYLRVGSAGMYGTSWTMSTADGWDAMLVALH